jgi:hypothetical protein
MPMKVKVKLSLYRSGQTITASGGPGTKISRQSANEGGCQSYAPAAFTHRYSCDSILLEAESTPGPQCDRKDRH